VEDRKTEDQEMMQDDDGMAEAGGRRLFEAV
jgi:hypothetical protein